MSLFCVYLHQAYDDVRHGLLHETTHLLLFFSNVGSLLAYVSADFYLTNYQYNE